MITSRIMHSKTIDLEAPIHLHYWNPSNNTIIALIEENGQYSIIKINGFNTAERAKRQLPSGFSFHSAEEIILSDDGDSILFFTVENVYAYSWTSGQVLVLDRPDIDTKITFDGGGFLSNNEAWIRLRDYNSIYLIQWVLNTAEWNWTKLDVHIKLKHYEEGGNFNCFRLEIHPSKKLFLGVADFDYGGFCSKLFYLLPAEEKGMKFIHPQGPEQETEIRHSHAFNLNGDKIACVKVLDSNDDDEYEVLVYGLNDFTKPLLSYRTPKHFDYINNIDFLANDDFILISNNESFIVVDIVKSKIIYKNKKGELSPQTGPDSCSFCTKNNTKLLIYKIDQKRDEIKDPLEVANNFILEYTEEIQMTTPAKTKIYPQLGLAPLLNVYHEFYSSKFDIRTGKKIKSKFDYRIPGLTEDKLPDYVLEEVRIWLEQNREIELKKWVEIIRERTKYSLEIEADTLYFYSTSESERSDSHISIDMVYESMEIRIILDSQFRLDDYLPLELSHVVGQWLKENFDDISKPWKDLPHFQSMKKDFFEKGDKEILAPQAHTKTNFNSPFEQNVPYKRKPEKLSFWQKLVQFLSQ